MGNQSSDSRDQPHEDVRNHKSSLPEHPPSPAVDEDRNTAEETEQNNGSTPPAEKETTTEVAAASATTTANGSSTTSSGSVLHNLTVFRDFFLAAFSDGYHSTFCGVDDVATCCKGSKVVPLNDAAGGSGIKSSRSLGASFDSPSIQQSTSHDHSRRRRRKPVAVAVGFNYTKDANGRPIVITPTGSRNSPIDLTNPIGGSNHSSTGVRSSPPRTNKGPAPSLPILSQGKGSKGTTPTTLPAIRPSQTHYRPTGPPSLAY